MTARLLLALLWHIPLFAWHMLSAVKAVGWSVFYKRLPLALVLIIAFSLLNVMHFIGFVLDEVLFRGYRRILIHMPIFIVGIPRSGTTHLQRVLAHDPLCTTLQTWEAIFAPSVTERYCCIFLGRLLGGVAKLLAPLGKRYFGRMNAIHKIGLNEAEEDFLLLLPLEACLLLAFVYPQHQPYWNLAKFHSTLPAAQRHFLLSYYKVCLQKHLYFHGANLRLLSKNPSFTSMLPDLLQDFPDAQIVACIRSPAEVVPSQLSALRPAFALLGNGQIPGEVREQLLQMLMHYYEILARYRAHVSCVEMTQLQTDLFVVLTFIYQYAQLEMSPVLETVYKNMAVASRSYKSKHHYSADEFGLTSHQLAAFDSLWPLRDLPH